MTADNLLQGMAILIAIQGLSMLILNLLGINFPAPLLGMLILFVLLRMNIVKEEIIDSACNLLITKMGLLFLAPAVGIMLYLDVIKNELLPILVTVFGCSIIILYSTAWFTSLFASKGGKK